MASYFLRALVFVAVALVAVGMSTAGWAQAPGHVMVAPKDLKWAPVKSLPGTEIAVLEGPLDQAVPFTFRLKMPAGYRIPPHWHPAIEHVTVVSGTFLIGMGEKADEKKMHALPAGGIAIMQPKTAHFAGAKEETIVQVHGIGPWQVNWVNPADAPKPAK
jgi:quercetin dioxygenase-like cupin family protein